MAWAQTKPPPAPARASASRSLGNEGSCPYSPLWLDDIRPRLQTVEALLALGFWKWCLAFGSFATSLHSIHFERGWPPACRTYCPAVQLHSPRSKSTAFEKWSRLRKCSPLILLKEVSSPGNLIILIIWSPQNVFFFIVVVWNRVSRYPG